jgi:YbgC/YbaW family acyl-CoA thioester hydrolase
MTLPSSPSIEVPIKVYFYDTDAGGVVHNISYLRWIETARSQLAESLGWSLVDMTAGSCPVVARTEIDYLKPAKLGDEVIVKTELFALERVRFFISYEIRKKSDGLLFSKAKQTMVPVDLKTGRPQALRKDWLEAWPQLLKNGE